MNIQHPLYSQHSPVGDPSLFGPGPFVASFLSEDDYFYHIGSNAQVKTDDNDNAQVETDDNDNDNEEDDIVPFTVVFISIF